MLLVLINRQILFGTIINKFILRNFIYISYQYILISTYLLKVSRDKQISLLIHLIRVFWQLSEPLTVISLDAVIPILVIYAFRNPSKKSVATIVSMTVQRKQAKQNNKTKIYTLTLTQKSRKLS